MTGLTIRNRRLTAGVVVFALVASIVALAARADGRDASTASSNDGGAWLANREVAGAAGVAHVEYSTRQATIGLAPFDAGARISVIQDERFTGVVDRSSWTLSVLDEANGREASKSSVPDGAVVRARPGGAAVFDETTSLLWWTGAGDLSSSADVDTLTELYDGNDRGRLVVFRSDRGAVVHDDRVVFLGANVSEHETVTLPPGFVADHVTAVGERVIAVDGDDWLAITRSDTTSIDVEDIGGIALLQQETSVGNAVGLVTSEGEPAVVDLRTGTTQAIGAGLAVSPTVRPIWHDQCLFVLGDDGSSIGLWALCAEGNIRLLPQDGGRVIPENAELRLVNDRIWLDSLDGTGWTVTPELDVLEIDARSAFDERQGDEEDTDGEPEQRLNQNSEDAETTDADEQDGDATNEPPTATDDEAATRLGRPVLVDVLLNDSDPDGDVLLVEEIVEVISGGDLARVEVAADGAGVQVTPSGQLGRVEARYRISDGSPGGEAEAVVAVEMKPFSNVDNLPPEPKLDRLRGAGGSIVSANLLRNDRDPDGDSILLVDVKESAGVDMLSVHPSGDVVLQLPRSVLSPTIEIPYLIADEWGLEATEVGILELTVRIDDTNTIPDARNDVVHTQVGRRVSIDLLANDIDGDNDELSIGESATPVGREIAGLLETTTDGIFTFEPQSAGTFVFVYAATDRSASDRAFVRVEVAPPAGNHAPVAVRDDVTLALGETRLVRALDNDGDADGELFAVVEWIDNSSLDIANEPGVGFWVTMTAGADVVETFSYRISDGSNDSDLGTVVVTQSDVAFADAAPVANDDSARVRPARTSRLFPLRNDYDPEGGRVLVTQTRSSDEVIVVAPGGNGEWIDVTVPADHVFPFTVQYDVQDTNGNASAANVEVSLVTDDDQNIGPTARRDVGFTREEQAIAVDVLANDDDPESDPISLAAIARQPAHGSASIEDDRTITYRPDPGFRGTDSFSYQIRDSQGAEAIGFVQVAVMRQSSTNSPPIADDDEYEFEAGSGTQSLFVLDNDADPDGDPLTIIDVIGNAVITPSGQSLRFTPPESLEEDRTFGLVYTIADGAGGTDTAEVTILVSSNLEPIQPVAVPDTDGPFREGDRITIDVLDNDLDEDGARDEDGAPAELTVTTDEPGVSVTAAGELVLVVPEARFIFEYTVTDPDGLSDSASVEVLVEPNLAPKVADDTHLGSFANEDVPSPINLEDFVVDPDGDPLIFSDVVADAGINVTLDQDESDARLVSIEPGTNFKGPSGLSFAVEDDFGNRVTGRITFTLLGQRNAPPEAADGAITIEAGVAQPYDLAGLFTDPDPDDRLTYTVSGPATGELSVTRSGSIVTLLADRASGGFTTTLEVTATDSSGESSDPAAVLEVTVEPSSIDPPSTTPDASQTVSGVRVTENLVDNDNDPLGEGLRIIRVEVQGGAAVGTADFDDITAGFTPAASFNGEAVLEYTVSDGRNGPEGQATGLWRIQVIGLPNTPSGLTAEETGPTTVSLTWNATGGNGSPVTAYEVEVNGDIRTEVTSPAWLAGELEPGVTYTFRVRGVNEAGAGPWSDPVDATPNVVPPTPGKPRVSLVPNEPGVLQVEWEIGENQGSAILEYRLEVGQCLSEERGGIGETIYLWSGLPNGERCSFRATAVNAAGASQPGAWSDPECAVAPPSAPSVAGAERGDKQAILTWVAPANPDCEGLAEYEIVRSAGGGIDSRSTVSGDILTATAPSLLNGVEYGFQVRARNRAGWGPLSGPPATVTPCGAPLNVPTPTVVRGDEQATVTWAGQANENGCTISEYRYSLTSGNQQPGVIGVGFGEGPIVSGGTITGLTNGVEYQLTIVAINDMGRSEPSAAAIFTPAGPPLRPTITADRCTPDVPELCFFLTSNGENGEPIFAAGGTPSFEYHEPGTWNGNDTTAAAFCTNNRGNPCLVEAGLFSRGVPGDGCLQNAQTVTASGYLENLVGQSDWATTSVTLTGCPPPPGLSLSTGFGGVTAIYSYSFDTDRAFIQVNGGEIDQLVGLGNGDGFFEPAAGGSTVTMVMYACNEAGCSQTTRSVTVVDLQAPTNVQCSQSNVREDIDRGTEWTETVSWTDASGGEVGHRVNFFVANQAAVGNVDPVLVTGASSYSFNTNAANDFVWVESVQAVGPDAALGPAAQVSCPHR